MIKKLVYLPLSLSLSLIISAQTDISEDFETQETNLTWFADDCFIDAHYSNPQQTDDNASGHVFLYEDIGGNYANVGFDYEPKFNLSGAHEFSVWIFVPDRKSVV